MGVPLQRGRLFNRTEAQGTADAIVINETMARRFWPADDPLGKRIRSNDPERAQGWLTIIGIVGDVREGPPGAAPSPEVYRYFRAPEADSMETTLVVRADSDARSVIAAVRREIGALDPSQPIANIRAMSEVVGGAVAPQRFNLVALSVLAGVALLLAAAGIYGVMGFTVAQRTHEIGVRVALGATRGDVFGLVLKQGMLLALAGLAAGVLAALATTRVITSLLFATSPTDPATFVAIAALLLVVAGLACWQPAWRATKVDPVVALRAE